MRVGYTHDLALVFEYQNMIDVLPGAEFGVLHPPRFDQTSDLRYIQFRKSRIVFGTVTEHPRDSRCRMVPECARGGLERLWRAWPHARMIVIENVNAAVVVVPHAADSRIAGTE